MLHSLCFDLFILILSLP